MPKFRKKPVEVEAMRYVAGNCADICTWADSIFEHEGGPVGCSINAPLLIPTLEGTMKASVGDWIIREPAPSGDRQFYPCKPDIFAATYEPADGAKEVS